MFLNLASFWYSSCERAMLILFFGSFWEMELVLMLSRIRLRMYEERGNPFDCASLERLSSRDLLMEMLSFLFLLM